MCSKLFDLDLLVVDIINYIIYKLDIRELVNMSVTSKKYRTLTNDRLSLLIYKKYISDNDDDLKLSINKYGSVKNLVLALPKLGDDIFHRIPGGGYPYYPDIIHKLQDLNHLSIIDMYKKKPLHFMNNYCDDDRTITYRLKSNIGILSAYQLNLFIWTLICNYFTYTHDYESTLNQLAKGGNIRMFARIYTKLGNPKMSTFIKTIIGAPQIYIKPLIESLWSVLTDSEKNTFIEVQQVIIKDDNDTFISNLLTYGIPDNIVILSEEDDNAINAPDVNDDDVEDIKRTLDVYIYTCQLAGYKSDDIFKNYPNSEAFAKLHKLIY